MKIEDALKYTGIVCWKSMPDDSEPDIGGYVKKINNKYYWYDFLSNLLKREVSEKELENDWVWQPYYNQYVTKTVGIKTIYYKLVKIYDVKTKAYHNKFKKFSEQL